MLYLIIEDLSYLTLSYLNRNTYYYLSDNFRDNKRLLAFALHNNHLDCLISAHKNGHIFDRFTCTYAVKAGSAVDCLEYLHKKGCEVSRFTCYNAAMSGNLSCLIYLLNNNCECDFDNTIYYAKVNGHEECARYVEEYLKVNNNLSKNIV